MLWWYDASCCVCVGGLCGSVAYCLSLLLIRRFVWVRARSFVSSLPITTDTHGDRTYAPSDMTPAGINSSRPAERPALPKAGLLLMMLDSQRAPIVIEVIVFQNFQLCMDFLGFDSCSAFSFLPRMLRNSFRLGRRGGCLVESAQ